jgi:tetratricopeptide (TPR) repeat protein
VEVDPQMSLAYYMLGVVSKEGGRLEPALGFLNKALALDPDYPKTHLAMGLIYREQGDYDAARRHLREFVNLDPDNPAAVKITAWLDRKPPMPDRRRR